MTDDRRGQVDGGPEAKVHKGKGNDRHAAAHRPENGDPKPLDLDHLSARGGDTRPTTWEEAMKLRDKPVMDRGGRF